MLELTPQLIKLLKPLKPFNICEALPNICELLPKFILEFIPTKFPILPNKLESEFIARQGFTAVVGCPPVVGG